MEAPHLNKYTPPSILQEFEWAWGILNRDDAVRESDVEPLLHRREDGRVVDLHLLPFDTVDAALAFERRKTIYAIDKQAFDCDCVVITLGLVESWRDRETGLHIL